MKKFLWSAMAMMMVSALSIGFTSCGDDDDPDEVSVGTSMVTLDQKGGSQSINIMSNTKWTVSGSQSWLQVSPMQGSGNGSIIITANENTEGSARTCILTVQAGTASSTVMVTQPGPIFDDDPTGSYVGTLKPMGYSNEPAPCYITITKLSSSTYRLTSLICEEFGININEGYNLVATKQSDGRITLKSETSYSIEASYFQGNLTLSFGMSSDTFFFTGIKNL